MPYIPEEERPQFQSGLNKLVPLIKTEGQLNYVITYLCHARIAMRGKSYDSCNAIHGVLDCASKELYRRLVAPYEDGKIKANGDVDPYFLITAEKFTPVVRQDKHEQGRPLHFTDDGAVYRRFEATRNKAKHCCHGCDGLNDRRVCAACPDCYLSIWKKIENVNVKIKGDTVR